MNPTFHLYGMKITLAGDLTAARDRVHLARLLMFKTKMVNVNNLDIIQNNLRLSDGTHVYVLSQYGFDSATIYVPPVPTLKKKKKVEKHPQFILPYFYASEQEFPWSGLLVFHGGYKLTEPYELFSPYGKEAYSTLLNIYQPYSYEKSNGEEEIIEWQVKEYLDPLTNVYWNEIPWMTGGTGWDPVYFDEYVEGSSFDKPYSVDRELLASTYPEPYNPISNPDGPGWPDWAIGNASWALTLGGSQIYTWSTSGILLDPEINTVKSQGSGVSTQWLNNAIDQEDPTNYAILYRTRDNLSYRGNGGYDFSQEYTNQKLIFQGIGHNRVISEVPLPDYCISYHADRFGWTEAYGYSTSLYMDIRLYKVGDKYISLFVIRSQPGSPADGSETAPIQKFIGCAVEGGAFNIVEVTDGIEFEDETRNLLSSSRLPTFGLLLRRGPAAIRHTYKMSKEQ